jgi:hypothetical protein
VASTELAVVPLSFLQKQIKGVQVPLATHLTSTHNAFLPSLHPIGIEVEVGELGHLVDSVQGTKLRREQSWILVDGFVLVGNGVQEFAARVHRRRALLAYDGASTLQRLAPEPNCRATTFAITLVPGMPLTQGVEHEFDVVAPENGAEVPHHVVVEEVWTTVAVSESHLESSEPAAAVCGQVELPHVPGEEATLCIAVLIGAMVVQILGLQDAAFHPLHSEDEKSRLREYRCRCWSL